MIIPYWYNIVKGFAKKSEWVFFMLRSSIESAEGNMFRLKELRERKKISQLKLAMDLNMNQNSISRYENEQREADYKTLIAFADYFGVSVDYLLGRSENSKM